MQTNRRPLLVAIGLLSMSITLGFGLMTHIAFALEHVEDAIQPDTSCIAVLCMENTRCVRGQCIPLSSAPSASSSGLIRGCSDIICPDGTHVPTCTQDVPPHPINYFADPCLQHGARSSASSAMWTPPVCGNGRCEADEADQFVQQHSCMMQPDGSCISPPPTLVPGTCPQDCPYRRFTGSVSSGASGPLPVFPDIPADDPLAVAALLLRSRNVIRGYPDGTFKPEQQVNRAEAIKMMVHAAFGGNASNTKIVPLRDVSTTDWFAPYVASAMEHGMVQGNPDGTLAPSRTVNTAELLKMLSVAFELPTDLPYTYNDVSSSDWFAPYAGIAEQYALFPSRTSQLRPAQPLTRREVALAIARAMEPTE